ncbi:PREDICTED: uncharacterized protein LOC106812060 isoform X2 [Priapulus caudatus]|uniref:Uncharacterized protein LOC106812060 isoform X2 n=1 Tax=Priapulus caudatus TaxID=37621 RepID=A0ABM1EGI9_PRICU|nr:PREDICTED: uncharacterized protein LOC106812060 isoform X2 [Priapulus caudatus]
MPASTLTSNNAVKAYCLIFITLYLTQAATSQFFVKGSGANLPRLGRRSEERIAPSLRIARARMLLEKFDADNSGGINREEFAKLDPVGMPLDAWRSRLMFDIWDKNDDELSETELGEI